MGHINVQIIRMDQKIHIFDLMEIKRHSLQHGSGKFGGYNSSKF
jgi:hypothetical protein